MIGGGNVKVLVLGAGGVIGQHMMVSEPEGVEAVYTRRVGDGVLYQGFDFTKDSTGELLDEHNPDVIVNLAGEGSVDAVEKAQAESYVVNVVLPSKLAEWCRQTGKHFIQVSSQAVLDQVNEYGVQKGIAEESVRLSGCKFSIVRPTFVLGILPFPGIGRENPAERILGGKEEASVNDRYFSVSFAWDVAECLWRIAMNDPTGDVLQVGNPGEAFSRLSVAHRLSVYPKPMRHDSLVNTAQRPQNTMYQEAWFRTSLDVGFSRLEMEFQQRELDTVSYRAKEIAACLNCGWDSCLENLNRGFGPLHNDVSADFREANPQGDEALLSWYRETEAYIWELTAYHLDKGFNYAGMSSGIAAALKSKGVEKVLCLGDGVGDLTLEMVKAGMTPWYHDLFCSCTAVFAESRFLMRLGDDWSKKIGLRETSTFTPLCTSEEMLGMAQPEDPETVVFDAIVSLDFLEHVPNVREWVESIHRNLKPGGWFVAQNAFNMGSGAEGAMPMHLSVNDHYERDWDPLLLEVGFRQEASNWYQKL